MSIRAKIKRQNNPIGQVGYDFSESFHILTEDGNILDAENSNDLVSKHELTNQYERTKNTLNRQNKIKASIKLNKNSAIYVPSGYSYKWGDNFTGNELNSNLWFVGMRDPVTGDLIPGADGDYLLSNKYSGYVTEEDSYVENGSLILRNQKRNYTGTSPAGTYDFTSGWVTSMNRGSINKGYIEVRAKFPIGDKVWPAIWMVSEDLVWGPEWDLWEYFGYRSNLIYDAMGTHLMTGYEQNGNLYPNQDPILWNTNYLLAFNTNYHADEWHIYGWEWTDTYARWLIDGVEVHTLLKSETADPSSWPDEEMYVILNNGIRTASPDITTIYPNTLEIDYIEVYQK